MRVYFTSYWFQILEISKISTSSIKNIAVNQIYTFIRLRYKKFKVINPPAYNSA